MSSSGARRCMRAHGREGDVRLNHIPECWLSVMKSVHVALGRLFLSSCLRVLGTWVPKRSSSPVVSSLTLKPNPCIKQINCRALQGRIWKLLPPTTCPLVPSNLQDTPGCLKALTRWGCSVSWDLAKVPGGGGSGVAGTPLPQGVSGNSQEAGSPRGGRGMGARCRAPPVFSDGWACVAPVWLSDCLWGVVPHTQPAALEGLGLTPHTS